MLQLGSYCTVLSVVKNNGQRAEDTHNYTPPDMREATEVQANRPEPLPVVSGGRALTGFETDEEHGASTLSPLLSHPHQQSQATLDCPLGGCAD